MKPGDPDHVELRYARSMTAGLAFVEEPSRVLIVGLGGGTIPMFLHQHYPRTQINVVDIDPAVIETAKAYFGFRETATVPRLRGGWTAVHREVPATVRCDLSRRLRAGEHSLRPDHPGIPPIRAARACAKGVVLANIWRSESNDLHDSMLRTYQEVFDDLHMLKVPRGGNEILAGFLTGSPSSPIA